MKRKLLVLLGLTALGAAALWADPPARVGRLSYLEGTVTFFQAADQGPQPASLNLPLAAGNELSTGDGSRAEVELGSSVLQIGPDTRIAFTALDDSAVAVQLDRGLASVRLRGFGAGETFTVSLRTAQVSLDPPGLYRIEQRDVGDATIVAREGLARVSGGGEAFNVQSGQMAAIPASGPDAYWVSAAPSRDSWDQWVAGRDSRGDELASAQYVSPLMDGVGDLDAYGSWSYFAGYGYAWCPASVPVGWAPYTVGQWVWLSPWGWTWVDGEPWGFAPFHYGRWAFLEGRWFWVPGPVGRPVFAPALVTWVGGAPRRGHPPDGNSVSWVPLQPHQPYRPLFPASATYLRAVNSAAALPPHAGMGPVTAIPFAPGRPGALLRAPLLPSAPLMSREPLARAPAVRAPAVRAPAARAPAARAPAVRAPAARAPAARAPAVRAPAVRAPAARAPAARAPAARAPAVRAPAARAPAVHPPMARAPIVRGPALPVRPGHGGQGTQQGGEPWWWWLEHRRAAHG